MRTLSIIFTVLFTALNGFATLAELRQSEGRFFVSAGLTGDNTCTAVAVRNNLKGNINALWYPKISETHMSLVKGTFILGGALLDYGLNFNGIELGKAESDVSYKLSFDYAQGFVVSGNKKTCYFRTINLGLGYLIERSSLSGEFTGIPITQKNLTHNLVGLLGFSAFSADWHLHINMQMIQSFDGSQETTYFRYAPDGEDDPIYREYSISQTRLNPSVQFSFSTGANWMDSVSLSLGYGYGEFMNQNKPSMNRYRNQVVYGLNLSLFRYLNVSFQCDYDSTGGKDNLFKTGLSIPLAGRQAPYDHFRF